MSKKYIRAEVILVPTENFVFKGVMTSKGGMLRVCDSEKLAVLYKKIWTPNHMHITTKEKIVTGDLVYHNSGFISRVLGFNLDAIKLEGGQHWTKDCRKIIGTTDRELGYGDEFGGWYPIADISKPFIEFFCNNGGNKNIMVEYSTDYDNIQYNEFGEYAPYKLNLDKDNSIIIKPSKNSWELTEVKDLMWMTWRAANVTFFGEEELREEFENWFSTITLELDANKFGKLNDRLI